MPLSNWSLSPLPQTPTREAADVSVVERALIVRLVTS